MILCVPRLRRWLPLVFLLCSSVSALLAQTATPAARPCLLNSERGEVADCLLTMPDGSRMVAHRYLRDLKFFRGGLALIRASEGWLYVNHKGRVVLDGIALFDGAPDLFREGLVRIQKDGKFGYADHKGRVMIAPSYDGALSFDRHRAEVCRECTLICADRQSKNACAYHVFSGGQWFSIDRHGRETPIPAREPEESAAR